MVSLHVAMRSRFLDMEEVPDSSSGRCIPISQVLVSFGGEHARSRFLHRVVMRVATNLATCPERSTP